MERYSSYKDSGVSWIGDIPEHWEVKQLRSFLTLFSEKGHGDAQLLSVTREQGVIERDKEDKEENHNFVPDDLSGYKYIEKGDFAINKMKAWQGSYAVSEYNGIVSPAYFTCKLKGVNKDFFSKAIRSKVYVPFFTQYSKGIRVGQWDLNPNALKSIPFFLPTPDEQSVIVKYIDDKTSKIDAYVADKEKEIELLQELKQKTIADAVTKGLKPDAKMKDSGISWIGEIPEQWEVCRMKRVFSEAKEKTTTESGTLLSLSQYTGITLKDDAKKVGMFEAESTIGYNVVHSGQFVMNIMLAWNGSYAVSDYEGIISPSYCVFNFNEDCEKKYFHYLLRLPAYAGAFKTMSKGIIESRLRLYPIYFLAFKTIIPPLNEQQAIVAYIEKKCQKIDKLASELQSEIDYLKEYKQRLIADCVTGQVNVQKI